MVNTKALMSTLYTDAHGQESNLWLVLDYLQNVIGRSWNYKDNSTNYFTREFLESVHEKADIEPLYWNYHKFHKSISGCDVTIEFAAEVISRTAIALNKTKPEGIFYLKALGRAADVLDINLSTEISL